MDVATVVWYCPRPVTRSSMPTLSSVSTSRRMSFGMKIVAKKATSPKTSRLQTPTITRRDFFIRDSESHSVWKK